MPEKRIQSSTLCTKSLLAAAEPTCGYLAEPHVLFAAMAGLLHRQIPAQGQPAAAVAFPKAFREGKGDKAAMAQTMGLILDLGQSVQAAAPPCQRPGGRLTWGEGVPIQATPLRFTASITS